MSKRKTSPNKWTFDFDVTTLTWAVYPCKVLRPVIGPFGYGLSVIQLADGSTHECRDDYLFDTEEIAKAELAKTARIVRDTNLKHDLVDYTKRIATCWKSIDFCTGLIEQLDKEKQ